MHPYLKHLMSAKKEADGISCSNGDICGLTRCDEIFMNGYDHAAFVLNALLEHKDTTPVMEAHLRFAVQVLYRFRGEELEQENQAPEAKDGSLA